MAVRVNGGDQEHESVDTYRGPDRRRRGRLDITSPFEASYAVAACFLIAVVGLSLLRLELPSATGDLGVAEVVAAAAASLLFVAGSVEIARWRVAGNTAALWHASAAFAAAALVGFRCVLPVVLDPANHDRLGAVAAASAATLLLLGLRAAFGPEVDLRSRPRAIAATAAAGLLTLSGLFLVADVELRAGVDPTPGTAGHVALATGWLVIAVAWTVRSRRAGAWTAAWFGLFAFALAGSEITAAIAAALDTEPGAGPMAIALVGALCAVLGSERGLRAAFDAQADDLDQERAERFVADRHARQFHAAAAERAHEARNALAAIDGAIRTLEKYQDTLPADTRAALSRGVTAEIGRLQRLVDLEERLDPPTAFPIGEVLEPVVTSARAQGLDVHADLPVDVEVFASADATVEVVQNLLVNVQRHAGVDEATVAASVDGDRVVITVADRGPGVPVEQRAHIFERGRRGEGGEHGQGLGLYVSRRIVRAQGGELWVDERPGGGAVFGFDLPRSPGSRQVPAANELDEIRHPHGAGSR